MRSNKSLLGGLSSGGRVGQEKLENKSVPILPILGPHFMVLEALAGINRDPVHLARETGTADF